MKYRKKPVVIDAFRLGTDVPPQWWNDAYQSGKAAPHLDCAIIKTLEGEMRAEAGDYVIKGVKGELYPCKPDIFELTYEAAE